MTAGEKWIAKAHARIAGWCKTRGWSCGSVVRVASRRKGYSGAEQFEVWIADRFGREGSIAFETNGGSPCLMDDYGIERDFSAVSFEKLLADHGLAEKVKANPKQLSLPVSP